MGMLAFFKHGLKLLLRNVALNGSEGLVADVVLHLAGVVHGGRLADAEGDEPLGNDGVPLVDFFRDFPPVFGQRQPTVRVDGKICLVLN